MQKFSLFTTSYLRFRPEMGTPVQASNGRPRWKLKYDLAHRCKEVYPSWSLVRANIGEAEFVARYHEELNTTGLDEIASRLRAIATAAGEDRLVLLCFEELSKPDVYCHRRAFASWWENLTGERVREHGPLGPEGYADDPLPIVTQLVDDEPPPF